MAHIQSLDRTKFEEKVNRRTLVFISAALEEEFVSNRKDDLIHAVRNAHKAFQSAPVVLGLGLANEFMNRDPEKAKDCPGAVEYIIAATCIIQLVIILVLLLCTPRCLARVSPRVCEVLAVAESFFFMALVSSTWDFFSARLMGADPYSCYWTKDGTHPGFTDSKLVLTWAIMQATIHLFFPIRWIILVPFEVACIVAYGCLAIAPAGATASAILGTWLMCAVLVILASMGKRQLERHERVAMLKYISEKTLRFETEFKLGQMEESARENRVAAPKSEASAAVSQSSAVSLPMSYYIFQASDGVDIGLRLQAIEAFGEKEFWLIKPDSLQCFPNMLLGRGGFGVVVLGCLAGAAAAIKLPVARGAMTLNDLANEIRIMRRIRHPNIVAFLGVCVVPQEELFMLVEEYVSGKSMKAALKDDQVSQTTRGSILLDVCRALLYLHGLDPAVAHGDLKPANILLQKTYETSFRAKLIDFGLSRIVSPESRPMGGSLKYMSPEILFHFAAKGDSVQIESSSYCCSDMFSYGRVVFFAATSQEPLHNVSNSDLLNAARENSGQPDLEWPDKLTPWQVQCRTLSAECLFEAPRSRISAKDMFPMLLSEFSARAVGDGQNTSQLVRNNLLDVMTVSPDTAASTADMPLSLPRVDSFVTDAPKDPVSAFREARLMYLGGQAKPHAASPLEARDAVISHFKLTI
eukprot:TRINITY_DN15722_c0_g1_i1.p1 TRINITY_DN15722_c0_g1~~TRINITY_DN15722_c0_g1_i1.p1  ORF type:complete len:714 (-),score=106.02 TRINITY_DN15722_c0_g1_i1:197-2278(-)